MSDHLWYPELPVALRRTSHLFLHLPAYHRVSNSHNTISSELEEQGFSVYGFTLRQGAAFKPPVGCDLALIRNVENPSIGPRALAALRVAVNAWVETAPDRKVVILSRKPRSSFPPGDGSSLILDALDVHLKECRLAQWVSSEYKSRFGTPPFAAAAESRGLASLLEACLERDHVANDDEIVAILQRNFSELGPAHISLIEEKVIDTSCVEISILDVPEWMQVELIQAGVAKLDEDDRHLCFFLLGSRKIWARALMQAARDSVEPPRGWAETAKCLYQIERTVRKRLADAFDESNGVNWAGQVLTAGEIDYVETAAGRRVSRVSNPLDFLTLPQLIDVWDRKITVLKPLGMTRTLQLDVGRCVPVRNRVTHMRLLGSSDLQTVRSVWQRMLMT